MNRFGDRNSKWGPKRNEFRAPVNHASCRSHPSEAEDLRLPTLECEIQARLLHLTTGAQVLVGTQPIGHFPLAARQVFDARGHVTLTVPRREVDDDNIELTGFLLPLGDEEVAMRFVL